MAENTANRANFEELMGHVTVLKARLESTLKTGNPPPSTQYEDLFDYYERAVSDRVMRNNTLMEELGEANQQLAAKKRQMCRVITMVALCVLGTCIAAIAIFFPEYSRKLTASPLCTHAASAIAGGFCALGGIALKQRRHVKVE